MTISKKQLMIRTTVLASVMALASAFSVGPSPFATRVSVTNAHTASNNNNKLLSQEPGSRAARFVAASSSEDTSSSDLLDTESSNGGIDLLDEVDSIFDCVDKNGDGKITQEELQIHLVDEMGYSKEYTTYLFESIDTDSDGSISREELRFAFYNFEALSMYMTFGMGGADVTKENAFKKLAVKSAHRYNEKDKDKLFLDDLADLLFDTIDTDQSGEITRKELQAHFDKVTEKLAKTTKDKATAEQAQEYVQTMFQTLDKNQDDGICREEVRAAFEKYDFKLLTRTFGWKVYQ